MFTCGDHCYGMLLVSEGICHTGGMHRVRPPNSLALAECPSMTDVILGRRRMLCVGVRPAVPPGVHAVGTGTVCTFKCSPLLALARYCRIPAQRDPAQGGW